MVKLLFVKDRAANRERVKELGDLQKLWEEDREKADEMLEPYEQLVCSLCGDWLTPSRTGLSQRHAHHKGDEPTAMKVNRLQETSQVFKTEQSPRWNRSTEPREYVEHLERELHRLNAESEPPSRIRRRTRMPSPKH
jgi:DnaJ-domain-containing protein 1